MSYLLTDLLDSLTPLRQLVDQFIVTYLSSFRRGRNHRIASPVSTPLDFSAITRPTHGLLCGSYGRGDLLDFPLWSLTQGVKESRTHTVNPYDLRGCSYRPVTTTLAVIVTVGAIGLPVSQAVAGPQAVEVSEAVTGPQAVAVL